MLQYEVFVSKMKREDLDGFMYGTFFVFYNEKDLMKFLKLCLDQGKCFEVEIINVMSE